MTYLCLMSTLFDLELLMSECEKKNTVLSVLTRLKAYSTLTKSS